MEAIGYLPPMDLFLEGEVTKAWIRIKPIRPEIWDGIGTGGFRGHRFALQKLLEGFNIPDLVSDETPEIKKWERGFQVDLKFNNSAPRYNSVTCFTAGAKVNAKAGSGFILRVDRTDTIIREAFPLGTFPSKFQAEMTAVMRAAEALLPCVHYGPITIHCDSQAVLVALNSPVIHSKTTLATHFALDELAEASQYSVKVAWATYRGNLCAQEALVLAQRGALLPPSEPEPVLPIPKSHTSSVINEAVEKRWNHRWTHETTTARQSRMFWPQIDKQKSNQLLLCNRQDFGEAIRLFTGHNYLNSPPIPNTGD